MRGGDVRPDSEMPNQASQARVPELASRGTIDQAGTGEGMLDVRPNRPERAANRYGTTRRKGSDAAATTRGGEPSPGSEVA